MMAPKIFQYWPSFGQVLMFPILFFTQIFFLNLCLGGVQVLRCSPVPRSPGSLNCKKKVEGYLSVHQIALYERQSQGPRPKSDLAALKINSNTENKWAIFQCKLP